MSVRIATRWLHHTIRSVVRSKTLPSSAMPTAKPKPAGTRKGRAMVNHCPLCKVRVSDWMMASGKTSTIEGEVYHNACLIDFELRNGHKFGEKAGSNGHDRAAGWTVAVPVRHSDRS